MAAASVKLSPTLKSIVNLSSALPSGIPAPSPAITSKLFDTIRSKAPPNLSRHAWLTLGTAALFTVNSPDAICQLWNYAGRNKEDAVVMREVGLKCISFNGVSIDKVCHMTSSWSVVDPTYYQWTWGFESSYAGWCKAGFDYAGVSVSHLSCSLIYWLLYNRAPFFFCVKLGF